MSGIVFTLNFRNDIILFVTNENLNVLIANGTIKVNYP